MAQYGGIQEVKIISDGSFLVSSLCVSILILWVPILVLSEHLTPTSDPCANSSPWGLQRSSRTWSPPPTSKSLRQRRCGHCLLQVHCSQPGPSSGWHWSSDSGTQIDNWPETVPVHSACPQGIAGQTNTGVVHNAKCASATLMYQGTIISVMSDTCVWPMMLKLWKEPVQIDWLKLSVFKVQSSSWPSALLSIPTNVQDK